MAINLFSTYKTGENRVTASIIAVLRALSLGRIERLLGALLEQSEFELVQFDNQPSKGGAGVPDARIYSSTHLLLETKVRRNTVRVPQLKRHLGRLDEQPARNERLLVLTPDIHRPKAIDAVGDDRLVWASFVALNQAIDELLTDPSEVVSERESFLMRELQAMLAAEKLVRVPGTAVVVAARNAWPQYLEMRAYICQANRTFRPVRHLGFYSHGEIHELVPQVLEVHDDVPIMPTLPAGRLRDVARLALKRGWQHPGAVKQVFLLTGPDDPRTIRLDCPIPNDLESESGQTVAFTMGQRYVDLKRLKIAKLASDLVGD